MKVRTVQFHDRLLQAVARNRKHAKDELRALKSQAGKEAQAEALQDELRQLDADVEEQVRLLDKARKKEFPESCE